MRSILPRMQPPNYPAVKLSSPPSQRDALSALETVAAWACSGSFDQMTPTDWIWLGRRLELLREGPRRSTSKRGDRLFRTRPSDSPSPQEALEKLNTTLAYLCNGPSDQLTPKEWMMIGGWVGKLERLIPVTQLGRKLLVTAPQYLRKAVLMRNVANSSHQCGLF